MLPKTLFRNAIRFACTLFCIVCCISGYTGSALSLNETEPTLHVNFDACVSFFGGSNTDYSEFTASSVVNPDCSEINLTSGFVYRSDSENNPHSCAPGFVNNSMCIDGLDNCNYTPGDNKSLKFDVEVIPGPNGFGSIKEMSFYHQAPESFTFIEGASGINDYPTLIGIRVLVEGVEIYKEEAIPTTRTWVNQTFDFSVINGFSVTDTTVFNIEILPYCLVGNGAAVRAWDIDELIITGACNDVNGGLITANESTIVCSSDTSSSIRTFMLELESGANFSWLVTDEDGIILELSDNGSFDFENFPNGIFNVYHIASESDLQGLEVNQNISDLEGCFDLSNAIAINNSKVIGGTLSSVSGDPILICSMDSIDNLVELELNGATGTETTYIIYDESGTIVSIGTSNLLDFITISEGEYTITAISHNGNLNATIGMNIENLEGCFEASNSLSLIKSFVNSGTISFDGQDMITACESSGLFGSNIKWINCWNY